MNQQYLINAMQRKPVQSTPQELINLERTAQLYSGQALMHICSNASPNVEYYRKKEGA